MSISSICSAVTDTRPISFFGGNEQSRANMMAKITTTISPGADE